MTDSDSVNLMRFHIYINICVCEIEATNDIGYVFKFVIVL